MRLEKLKPLKVEDAYLSWLAAPVSIYVLYDNRFSRVLTLTLHYDKESIRFGKGTVRNTSINCFIGSTQMGQRSFFRAIGPASNEQSRCICRRASLSWTRNRSGLTLTKAPDAFGSWPSTRREPSFITELMRGPTSISKPAW